MFIEMLDEWLTLRDKKIAAEYGYPEYAYVQPPEEAARMDFLAAEINNLVHGVVP